MKLFTADDTNRLRETYSSNESSVSDNIVDITEEETEETEKAKAEKKKLKNDIYTLVGTANINPCSTVIPQLVTAKTVEINGVGAMKFEKYGQDFIDVIKEFKDAADKSSTD